MKVSIIIPVYNVEAYILECLESVARQSFQGEMECLIVDDCGTDKSISVAEQFIQGYQGNIQFRVLQHDYNRGLSAARNTGVKEASGGYIYFLDSDDAIMPETIEKLMEVVHDHPEVEMVQGGIASINGKIISDFTTKELPTYTNDAMWIAKNILLRLPVSSCNRLLRREFLLEENITFHEGIIHEDVPYNYILAIKCRSVGFVRRNTYLFRPQREGSITTSPQEERALQSRLIIMQDCIDAFISHQFETKNLQSFALRALWGKWMNYMTIHSYKVLKDNKCRMSSILKKLCAITPGYMRLFAFLYSLLPLRLKHNRLFIKILNLC